MSVCMTPAGVNYIFACLLQESSMSVCKNSCRSHMSQCMTYAGVKYLQACLLQESSMSVCMTPAGVKYLNV